MKKKKLIVRENSLSKKDQELLKNRPVEKFRKTQEILRKEGTHPRIY